MFVVDDLARADDSVVQLFQRNYGAISDFKRTMPNRALYNYRVPGNDPGSVVNNEKLMDMFADRNTTFYTKASIGFILYNAETEQYMLATGWKTFLLTK